MNELTVTGIACLEKAEVEKHEVYDGHQVIVKFPNGYGASIVKHQFSYGVELAVLKGDSLCYDTPITCDVIGNLTPEELEKTLEKISELPEA